MARATSDDSGESFPLIVPVAKKGLFLFANSFLPSFFSFSPFFLSCGDHCGGPIGQRLHRRTRFLSNDEEIDALLPPFFFSFFFPLPFFLGAIARCRARDWWRGCMAVDPEFLIRLATTRSRSIIYVLSSPLFSFFFFSLIAVEGSARNS